MQAPVGLILAGGQSRRMGGASKAELMLGGRRLLDHCTDRLEPQVSALAVNSNTAISCDFPVRADTITGHLGPLAGILTGMIWATDQGATHLATAAVDTPFLPCDLIPRLQLTGDFAIAATPDGPHGTFGLWPVSLRDDLAAFLQNGGRKVRAFTDTHNAATAMFPDSTPNPFFNINTPDDLAQAEAWA